MPNLYPDLEAEAASPDSNTLKTLNLVVPFKDKKRGVLAFIANVDTAFEVIDPRNEGTLFKFGLTRIVICM